MDVIQRKKMLEKIIDSVIDEALNGSQPELIRDIDSCFEYILTKCYPEGVPPEKEKEIIKKLVKAKLEPDKKSKKKEPIINIIEEACEHCVGGSKPCQNACVVDAIKFDENGKHTIDEEKCVYCGLCANACRSGAIVERSEFLQVINMIRRRDNNPVYAILAPSFVGQFGDKVLPEQVKAGLKRLGFTDVFEVALAADVITIQEAREFIDRMGRGENFMITSCCCPAFIKLVEKHRPKVAHLVSESVSPMIAMGRFIKAREKNARVVFIGPCIAKKNEAKLPDLNDAVDCVLTFYELSRLFNVAKIKLVEMDKLPILDAAHDGRTFAHTGGVTQAITRSIKSMRPDLEVKAVKGNGLKQCNELLKEIEEKGLEANFMEGMGCPGGCVAGPATLVPVKVSTPKVAEFADKSPFIESISNPRALNLFERYGNMTQLLSKKKKVRV
ncbi:MAG: hypothetical protein PWQ82_1054 [Thermosediminibacterales bacterium]|nr:hypothetical protein [Thermosediminibacterales bacterium]MDK2836297.1 hypothetical protein [Thermosediminibacterales bacterium]